MSSHRYWRALSLPLLLALLAGAVITTGRSPVAEVSAQPAGARLARLPFGAAADTGPRTVAPFRMVGVSWPADAAAGAVQAPVAVEVRVRREGAWTGWQRLHVDGDREDGAARRLATSPVWVGEGGADGVQARFVGRVPRRAEVVLVEPGSGPAYAPVAALPGSPSLVTRAGWGADETLRTEHPDPTCTGTPDYGTTVRAAFVHHTFHSATGSNDYTADESDDIVRGIYQFHTANGFCDLGYNFLVDRFGTVFEGRWGGTELPVVGGHTGGFNTNSFGVAVIGDHQQVAPTDATLDSVARLIAWKLGRNYRDPLGTATFGDRQFAVISGHRDTKATECPGEMLYDALPALRAQVDALLPAYDTPIYRRWQALGGEPGWVGSPYWGEHDARGGVTARFSGDPDTIGDWVEIWWSSGTGARALHGPIRSRFAQVTSLGLPTSDVLVGQRSGSRYARFQQGRIYWSSTTGARIVRGPVLSRYAGLGAEASRLALPVAEQVAGRRTGSQLQRFQGGRIYWSSATGAHPVWGRILTSYVNLGAEASRLRLPVAAERAVTDGLVQRFQGGSLRWSKRTNRVTVHWY